ncbi:hypothetical protein NW767_013901 [Fusarium falciforme]|nr:hypothetical protein NW767_013901 [Fusarium falciforme]
MEPAPDPFSEFAEHYKDQPEVVQWARNLLAWRPDYQRPTQLVPLEDYQRRLEAIERIRRDQRATRSDTSWEFSALQFSVLILMPLQDLEDFTSRDSPAMYLDQLNELFNFFLQDRNKFVDLEEAARRIAAQKARQKERRDASKASTSKLSVPPPKSESEMASEAATERSKKEKMIRRNDEARDNALGFDSNLCLVTGMVDPDGCHIMPFTTNDRPSYLAKVQSFRAAIATCFGLGRGVGRAAAREPLFAGLGTSDRDFNILSLTPSLHRFWSRCYCAFKWHGLSKVDGKETYVLLQFHWMPRSSHINGARYINLDDQNDPQCNRSIIGGLSHHYGPDGNPHCSTEECANCKKTHGCSIVNVVHGHPLRSGHLFTVKRSTATIESFHQMIDLQWAIIRAAAMSGAALAPELLVGPADDDDDDGFPVDMLLDWREEVQAGDPEAPPEESPEVAEESVRAEEQAMAHGRHGS